MISILFMRLSAVSCTSLVQEAMSSSLFFVSVSVRLREGEVNGWKGERSQFIVRLVPMGFLEVSCWCQWSPIGITGC